MTSQPSRALLLALPLEIRYHIFSFFMSSPLSIQLSLTPLSALTTTTTLTFPTRGHLASLSETCTQLRFEISIWASTTVYPTYSTTSLFGIIDPRITTCDIVFGMDTYSEGLEEFEGCEFEEGEVWDFKAPLDVVDCEEGVRTLDYFCRKGVLYTGGRKQVLKMEEGESGEGKEEVLG